MIFYFLLSIGILIGLRFTLYHYKFLQAKKQFTKYEEYLSNPTFEFSQSKPQIVNLFKEAGLSDFSIQRLEPAGYGKLKSLNASGFENITSTDEDVVINTTKRFNECLGVFRYRRNQSINPFFWIEFIFKLPQYIYQFVGVLPENIIVKISLLIYWLIAILFGLKKFDILELIFKK